MKNKNIFFDIFSMKYISTLETAISEYNDTFINVLPYTKLLNVNIKNGQLSLLFQGDYNCTNPSNTYGPLKSFTFKVIKGNYLNNVSVDEIFEFHSSIRSINDDFIEYYNIFFIENKTTDELRDDRISEIIEE